MAEEEKEKIATKKTENPEAKDQKIAGVNAIKEETIVEPAPKDTNLAKAQKIQKVAQAALLFEKYSYDDVVISDISLKNYINLKPLEYPTTLRTDSQKMFSKININIIERLENSLMKGGTGGKISGKVIRTKGSLQGKKLKVMHLIEKAFDKVHKNTGQNPIQIFINALENSAPIEDTTRVRYGGIISNVAVDVSASRRLDIALRNIAYATIIGAFASKRNFVDTLSNEIILAAKNDMNSYAIKRKNEIERMARSAK
ncbi:MAG: 30S ribosomal protein S7 [Candidatus Marsarchaeota archaeon]|nr:30S ribosomal protein S7 [Candidatus Marsarchaeota archaeon]